ncbi:MAG TPA: TetR family transcriptional regulator [Vicinamibacterales bacterium]|nr:TetR family transcriptional regulator [Vicinamibacterales bacterium]
MPLGQPRLRYKEQVRAALRSALLREAGASLLRDGCHGVRIDDVACACGIAKGTAYLQFSSRSELLGGAVQQLDEALAAKLAAPPATIAGPRATLRWTVLEAVDAQIASLAAQPLLTDAARARLAWPCCQRITPCPYGGAARSLSVIDRRARALAKPHSDVATPRNVADLLMAISIAKLVKPPMRPPAPAHRRFIARLFDLLLA